MSIPPGQLGRTVDKSRTQSARRRVWEKMSPPLFWAWQFHPTVFWVLSLFLLAAAFCILAYALWVAVAYTLANPSPPCSNPPSRTGTPPQWQVVGLCLLAFVVGHVTARWQLVASRTSSSESTVPTLSRLEGRAAVMPPLSTSTSSVPAHYSPSNTVDPSPDDDPRKREMLIVQALLLVFLVEVLGLLVIEMVTLSRGVWPITYYVRCAYDAAGWPTTLAAASVLFLVGRWFWLPRGRDAGSSA